MSANDKLKKDRDHFVSKVYLERFCDKQGCIHVFSKKEDKSFSTTPEEVCVKRGWDNIKGLPDELELRKILQTLEPNLNSWINSLIMQKITKEEKFKLSHYFSILDFLNPQSISSHQDMNRVLQSHFPNLSFPDINKNKLRKEYLNMSNILTHIIYTSRWQLINNQTDFRLLTCDYPIHCLNINPIGNFQPRYIALNDKYALIIHHPTLEQAEEIYRNTLSDKTSYPMGDILYSEVNSKKKIREYNIYTISNTDRHIISSENTKSIASFIKDNKNKATKPNIKEVPLEDGRLLILFGQENNF